MKLLVQFVGVPERARDFHVAFHNLGVPDLVKIGRIIFTLRMESVGERLVAKIFHRHAVSAVVGIGDGVQRLVHIAHKVDEITYRFGAFQGIGGLVFQDGTLLFNSARHTSLPTAVSAQIPLMFLPRNVDVVPRTVLALIAHIIRPCRRIHHQIRRGIPAPAFQLRIDGVVAKKLLQPVAALPASGASLRSRLRSRDLCNPMPWRVERLLSGARERLEEA